jgi:hypothetical protein
MEPIKKIYICRRLSGKNPEKNIEMAKKIARKLFKKGLFPIVSHAYTDIIAPELVDYISKDRDRIMQISIILLSLCDEIWVYGRISNGMQREIEYAQEHGIPVRRKRDAGR